MTEREAKERMVRALTGKCLVVISDRTHVLRFEWENNCGIAWPYRLKTALHLMGYFTDKGIKILSLKQRRKALRKDPVWIRWAP